MRNSHLTFILALAALLVAHGCDQRATARVHRIEIRDMAYAPAEVTVAPGDTIVWVNRDIVPHTVTADARRFDSGSVSPSAEWSLVARDRGRTSYTCVFHPTMKGAIVVK
jgi:plastocyanin